MNANILHNLSSVPLWAWAIFTGYCLVQLALYWWGLPFARDRKTLVGVKPVSHGVDTCVHNEKVYRAVYTAANAITVLGLAGLGVTTGLVLSSIFLPLVPFLFAASVGLSDVLDGAAAMRHDEHSILGAAIDPIRDRLAIAVILIVVMQVIGIDWWIIAAVPMLVFEFWVMYMGRSAQRRQAALTTHGSGKYRQVAHLAVIGMLLTAFYLVSNIDLDTAQALTVVGLLIMGLASSLAAHEYHRQSK